MPALCGGIDWAGRSQERRADGRAGGAGRLRPVASFRFGRGLERGSSGVELALQADRLVGGADAFLVIDDTTLPKKGTHSVGVAPQYASALGKTANCQTLVSLTLAGGEVPVMVGLRLFLPESWTNDAVRLERAGVPLEYQAARAKPEIALAELDRLIGSGVRFGAVLADAGYGMSAPFRQALSARGLAWAVGVPRHQKVYLPGVELVFPVAGRGRPRKRHVPNVLSVAAEEMLANEKWRVAAWRKGTKGLLKARFAAVRVRVADGPPQRIGAKGMQHMPGEEVWLVGERRTVRRTEILSREPPGRRRPQDAGRDDQGALGLRAGSPATQGGTRPRPLRGPLMAGPSSPCADDHDRLRLPPAPSPRRRERGKKILWGPPKPTLPAIRKAVVLALARAPPYRCPHCRRRIRRKLE